METEKYDSYNDTWAHINRVRVLLAEVQEKLRVRGVVHDASKLDTPEKEVFDEMTPKLRASTYGSEEYKAMLAGMKPALDHHYAANSHHPEHFSPSECILCFTPQPRDPSLCCPKCGNGQFGKPAPTIQRMNLLDLLEMLCDWKAAGERHVNGSIENSLKVNRERFGIDDQLFRILENTVCDMF